MKLETERDRQVWNAAIRAAMRACRVVDDAAHGQGHQLRRAPTGVAQPRNPNAHRSGEISLGALRAKDEVAGLLR